MKIQFIFIFFLLPFRILFAQAYFADGYHGGIYGHYPLWQTQFMVDKLREYPAWKINLEIEPETWDSVKVKTPEAYRQFKQIAAGPEIEFTNPAYAQPYCFNISGESIIRQFQYGFKKLKQHFPDLTFQTYCVEEPCFTSSLPQLLRSFGFQYAVLKNPNTCWGGYVRGYGNGLIRWTGPDGTSILTLPRYACEDLVQNSTWQTMAWNNSDEYLQACREAGVQYPAGMCYQDAGWKNGPWIGYGENIKNRSSYITWKEYFSSLAAASEITADWRLSQEDIQVSLMWGSQALQRIAQQVRRSENRLVQAEKIAAMAMLENGFMLPDTLQDEAWRTLLLAQHHDSWIVPYNRLRKDRTWAEEIARWTDNTNRLAETIIQESLPATAGASFPDTLGYLRIYNTFPQGKKEIIALKLPEHLHGRQIKALDYRGETLKSNLQVKEEGVYWTAEVSLPAFGYTTVLLREAENEPAFAEAGIVINPDNECMMENDLYRITFDLSHGGKIKSLIAKKLGNREFVDTGNSFGFNELRGYFYEEERFISSQEQAARVSILEDNAFRKQIKLESTIAGNTCYQTVTLLQSQERIDFALQIDWNGNVKIGEYCQKADWQKNRRAFYDDRFKLNVLFPLALDRPEIYRDAPFDVCKSRLENTFYNTWDSIKNNVILHWVDLLQEDGAYGMALLSDHTTSCSHGNDFPLGLTLQYSGIGLWGHDYSVEQGLQLEYALIPHRGKWDESGIGTKSSEWNEKTPVLFQENGEMLERSFLQFDRDGYELSAVTSEGNALIVRIFNQEGDERDLHIRFNFPAASCEDIRLNGETERIYPLHDNGVTVALPRFGIKTLRILIKNK
jgi:alpha-mannosidase